jgi:hypothetical protein
MFAQILPFQPKQKQRVREDFLTRALNIARQLNREDMSDAECDKAFADLPTFNMKERTND